MAEAASPEPRYSHESAMIGHELHVFGGKNGKEDYFPRNEIWTCNVREETKWIRRIAEGTKIPPSCIGARCVVINGIVYSYGGWKEGGGYLEDFFGLDPVKMRWFQVATPTHKKNPWQRFDCCLWAIGERMIVFGGVTDSIPEDRVQVGAQCNWFVNNEIYEFVFEEGREKGESLLNYIQICVYFKGRFLGYWLDVDLSGERPQPRTKAAMETIDEHRGLLHGGSNGTKSFDDAFVIDLREKVDPNYVWQ